MPRPRNQIPTYCVARSGRAFTKIDGEFVSLGKDGPEAKVKYARLLEELAKGKSHDPKSAVTHPPAGLTCNELCLAFVGFATEEYVDRESGEPSKEVACYCSAIKPLRELFGLTPAADFGPNKLRAVREKYILAKWSRGFINKSVIRIRHIWRWGVAREMVPADALERLRALEPLKRGKSAANETEPRTAVPMADVEAVKQRMRPRNQDLIDLLLLSGARPSEVLGLTTAMIQSRETRDGIWIVPLEHHKNAHRGHSRRLYFNAAAQAILLKYLRIDDPDGRLFPIDRDSFTKLVKQACERAQVKVFTPHWLRHTCLTRVADEVGVEAAQRVAGHAHLDMTANYSRAADKQALEAVKKLG